MPGIIEKNANALSDILNNVLNTKTENTATPELQPKVPGSLQLSGLQERSLDQDASFMDDQGAIREKDAYNPVKNDSEYISHPDDEGLLEFQLPEYGYPQYINDMSAWQKQIREINGEIGWFYFKVFFNFNTEYGLLGGLSRKDANVRINSANTAIKYLDSISSSWMYSNNKIKDRMLALYKFGNTLKHISLDSPWFFKGVSGLADIPQPYTADFQKERKLSIICSEEAVDMRIGTLMDLYKYACFDNINCKEIIPRNLRKFEMSIIIMHMPLKFHHEPSILVNGDNMQHAMPGKGLNISSGSFSSLASFKMFTFQNCEFDLEGLGSYYGDQMSNEAPFSMGKNQINIKYDRTFEHRMNEWNEFLLGDDGFYYNNNDVSNINMNFKVNEDPDSMHRELLNRINSNHENSNQALISYSEYFINKVWLAHSISVDRRLGGSGKWADLIADLKAQTSGISNSFNNIENAWWKLQDTWNMNNSEKP